MSHLRSGTGEILCDHEDEHDFLPHGFDPETHEHEHEHEQDNDHDHEHSHAPFIDPSIMRSRAGIKAVSLSLVVLTLTAAAQTAIYVLVLSVALLADLIHNFGGRAHRDPARAPLSSFAAPAVSVGPASPSS